MKIQVLIVIVISLIASGCMMIDTGTRSGDVPATYGSADEPYPVLNAYGNWIDVPEYGRVWQPAVMSDWRPFANGQWVWTDQGWMFDSDEPFGWVVYHYGEWVQTPALGWIWIPGTDWSPARVDWYDQGDYVGWAPMAPPRAVHPDVYQPGYENYWTMVPAPQFTRLNVGAYRTTPPPPKLPPAASRGRAVDRAPDIIKIQGATHQLISPLKTEREQVRVGQRTVSRVSVQQDERPAAPQEVLYAAPGTPGVAQPSSPVRQIPPAGRIAPRPAAPAVVLPPPVQERTPSPVRVTPVPAPVRVAPAPAPVVPRVTVPEKPPERREVKQPEVRKPGR